MPAAGKAPLAALCRDEPSLLPCDSQCKALITGNHPERPTIEILKSFTEVSRQNQGLQRIFMLGRESIGFHSAQDHEQPSHSQHCYTSPPRAPSQTTLQFCCLMLSVTKPLLITVCKLITFITLSIEPKEPRASQIPALTVISL